jgi:P27 family predicted phage terminase small subunit
MGKRGYPPRPTNLRILRGDHPERVNRDEPQPADLPVSRPPWLSDEARRKWDDLAPQLDFMGVLTVVDVDMLASYCECYARWRRLVVMAAKSPPVFKRAGRPGDDGAEETVLVKNPLWGQVRDATSELRVLAREFGLTPSARSGLHAGGAGALPGERLLTGG